LQFEATVSAINSLGKIEVWLDSIDTGIKIADCPITSSGSLSIFKPYKSSVDAITGMHDVYLRFVGSGTEELFILKSFRFIDTSLLLNTNGLIKEKSSLNNLVIYPNPIKNQFSLKSDIEFTGVRVLQLNGKVLYDYNLKSAVNEASFPFNQPPGSYIFEITNVNGRYFRKMIVN